MRAFTLFLALTLAIPTFGVESAPQIQQDKTWMEISCRTQGKRACLMAYGWHWLRKANVVIDPALATTTVSAGVYGTVVLAKYVAGAATGGEYLLMAARAGMKAGIIVLVGAAVFTVVATLATAGSFLLESTTQTAPKSDDQFPQACHDILEHLKKHGGLGEISKLTPQQMEILIPCLPKESGLSNVLADIGQQAMALDQVQNSPL